MRNRFFTFAVSAVLGLCPLAVGQFPCIASDTSPLSPAPAERASDIEQHVSRAIASAFLCDSRNLEDEYLFFKSLDKFMIAHDQSSTDLSDNILDLTVCTISDRDAFIEAQRKLLKETPDKELKQRVNYRLRDELSSADSLMLTDRYNRFTLLFNTFVRPLSLVSIGYFPALIDAGVATALSLNKFTELSLEEKKALVLYKQFLRKYPDSDHADLLRQRVTRLDRKRIKTLYKQELSAAERMISRESFWQAQQHYKNALAYCPDGKEALKGFGDARKLELEKNRLKLRTLEPADKSKEFHETSNDKDYQDILYAVAGGSPEMVIYEAEDYLSRYPDSSHVPLALYTITVAHDMKGAHHKAKELLKELADGYPGTHIGRHSDAYLRDPGYNLLRVFTESCRERGMDTTQYVFLGPEFAKTNIILGTSRFITQGLQALGSLGIFNVMAMGIRGSNTLYRNPVSDQEVIDNGLKFLRRCPDSPDAPDVHLVIARAYEKRKNLSKAAYHYRASGKVGEKKVESIKEKAAKQYLDFAEATDNRSEKMQCYDTILARYPRSETAVTALEKLALIERTREPLFALDKQTIAEHPLLFKLSGLHLGPHLLDGDRANGEVASRGIYSPQSGKITIVYADGHDEREQTVGIDYETYKSLLAFAEELEYRKKSREIVKSGRRQKIPVEVRGSIGDDGVFVYPRLKAIPYEKKDQYLYQ